MPAPGTTEILETNANGDLIRTYSTAGWTDAFVWRNGPPAAITNEATLNDRARQAYTANRTFLAIGSPSNAQILAQVRALTKQNQGLIRLLVARDLLDDPTVD